MLFIFIEQKIDILSVNYSPDSLFLVREILSIVMN